MALCIRVSGHPWIMQFSFLFLFFFFLFMCGVVLCCHCGAKSTGTNPGFITAGSTSANCMRTCLNVSLRMWHHSMVSKGIPVTQMCCGAPIAWTAQILPSESSVSTFMRSTLNLGYVILSNLEGALLSPGQCMLCGQLPSIMSQECCCNSWENY